jgi:hypothetical protein
VVAHIGRYVANISRLGGKYIRVHTQPTGAQISGKRRLQISEFKGNTMVSIREFYEKDGQMLPGKKVGDADCEPDKVWSWLMIYRAFP